MMESLTRKNITCPYCSAQNSVVIDATDIDNEYIEDCQVCCQPITFLITNAEHLGIDVQVRTESDVY